MNIFILDKDPAISASYHCDKHVVKMIVESLQILGSTHWFVNGIKTKSKISESGNKIFDIWENFPRKDNGLIKPYGIGFMNHPCTKWARESIDNWEWLCSLTENLILQYENRYNKKSSASSILKWFMDNKPDIERKGLTSFYQAVPSEIKSDDAVHTYRLYYAGWKKRFAKWKNREPDWWEKYLKLTEYK